MNNMFHNQIIWHRATRSKDDTKATAVSIKLQRSNVLICFTEHTLKRNEGGNFAPLRSSVNELLHQQAEGCTWRDR